MVISSINPIFLSAENPPQTFEKAVLSMHLESWAIYNMKQVKAFVPKFKFRNWCCRGITTFQTMTFLQQDTGIPTDNIPDHQGVINVYVCTFGRNFPCWFAFRLHIKKAPLWRPYTLKQNNILNRVFERLD